MEEKLGVESVTLYDEDDEIDLSDPVLARFHDDYLIGWDIDDLRFNSDDGGSSIDVYIPERDAQELRTELPCRWRKYNIFVLYRHRIPAV